MHAEDAAGNEPIRTSLTVSWNANELKQRGFRTDVDNTAGSFRQALASGTC
jgi:hypothetical protein